MKKELKPAMAKVLRVIATVSGLAAGVIFVFVPLRMLSVTVILLILGLGAVALICLNASDHISDESPLVRPWSADRHNSSGEPTKQAAQASGNATGAAPHSGWRPRVRSQRWRR